MRVARTNWISPSLTFLSSRMAVEQPRPRGRGELDGDREPGAKEKFFDARRLGGRQPGQFDGNSGGGHRPMEMASPCR